MISIYTAWGHASESKHLANPGSKVGCRRFILPADYHTGAFERLRYSVGGAIGTDRIAQAGR